MPRTARIKSHYLHVIVRGIGKQLLFEDDFDRRHYLKLLRRFRDEAGVIIVAYCLMENHVHMLVNDPGDSIAFFMKKLGISYAQYFNRKYERSGHLFQDRYKSEAIRDVKSYLTVYRYVLNNPAKAGIAKAASYKWSSYHEYGDTNGITDTSSLREMIGSRKELDRFLSVEDVGECMEDEKQKHDDQWALKIIHNELGLVSGTELQKLGKDARNQILVELKERGLTIRQIERLTGINRGAIQRAR